MKRIQVSKHNWLVPLLFVLVLVLGACEVAPSADNEVEGTVQSEATGENVVDQEAVDEAVTTSPLAARGIAGTEGNLLRGYTLLDSSFKNQDGAVSGAIEDLLVDVSSGQVLFAAIEYGGFLDLGDTNLVVPLNALQWGSEDNLILNFDEQELSSFPEVGENWPDLTDPNWDDEINTFWRNVNIDPGFDFDETNSSMVMWLSEMTGYTLVDLGVGVGTIHDVLVNLNESHIQYILFDFGTTPVDDDSFIIPYSALDVRATDDEGVFTNNEIAFDSEIDLDTLRTAPRFDPILYPEADLIESGFSAEIDNYWAERGFEVN